MKCTILITGATGNLGSRAPSTHPPTGAQYKTETDVMEPPKSSQVGSSSWSSRVGAWIRLTKKRRGFPSFFSLIIPQDCLCDGLPIQLPFHCQVCEQKLH